MRELKFRAWDNKQNHWVNGLHFSMHLTGNITDPVQGNLLMNDHYEVQQFTGLYDKNGKEIYEGDIISYGQWTDGKGECLHKVYWKERDAAFASWDLRYNRWGGQLDASGEVIGNIYENPELLEK